MERNLPLKLKSMVLTINKHEIWEMKRFVEEELGLEFRFDSTINARIDCSQSPLRVRLSPEEVVELDVQDPKRMAEWRRLNEQFGGPVHAPDRCNELYQCGAGVAYFSIDPYGKLGICLLSDDIRWDLRHGSFQEGWEGFLLEVRKKKSERQTKCTLCEIKALCDMCPPNGELENGDPEEPVEFLCEVTHLRARALGIPVKDHGECQYCEELKLEESCHAG